MLEVYTTTQDNILKNICRSNQNKRMFSVIWDWLHQINKVPIERIRDVLQRVEQFRFDALVLP